MPTSFAPMVEDEGLNDAISGVVLGCNRFIQVNNAQSSNREQRRDKNWRRERAAEGKLARPWRLFGCWASVRVLR
jgi:hypothetical protein